MKWMEVEISIAAVAAEAIGEKLTEAGADGISVIDADEWHFHMRRGDAGAYAAEESPGDCEDSANALVRAYFPLSEKMNQHELVSKINSDIHTVGLYLDVGETAVRIKTVDDQDWAHSWKKYYRPIRISAHTVVVPSWETYEPADSERIIQLDPGSAFGTGEHETTAMCAELLDEELTAIKQNNSGTIALENIRVLDLGCGSGILAVLAAVLGADSVDAVDIDETAVRVARENIRLNHMESRINCFTAVASSLKGPPYDVIVANIIADVIDSAASDIRRLLKPGGIFIAGGIIESKGNRIETEYKHIGFRLLTRMQKNDWITFRLARE